MDTFTYRKRVSKTHSSAWDIIDMVKDNEIDNLIIAHIMPNAHYANKWIEELKLFVEQETGVRTWIPGERGLEWVI
jgi:ribonuclease BN (tRNA processing enzyme)